jgi:hypothetical protein
MYAMVKDKIVFNLENQKEAERILREEGLKLLTQEEVSKL